MEMAPAEPKSFSPILSGDSGLHAPAPIIVGAARSGTTLLRLMLDAHPDLAVTHEAGFIPSVANLINPFSRMFYVRMKNRAWRFLDRGALREELFRTITEFGNWDDLHLSRSEFGQALRAIEPFSLADGIRAFFRLYAQRFQKSHWGEKTPFYVRHLRSIESVLPEAYFIHLIRDGRDVAVSSKGLSFVPNNHDVKAMATNWADTIVTARKQARHCRHYIEVRYEDLIPYTSSELQKICAFINLTYEPRMEHYYETARERMGDLGPGSNRSFGSTDARLESHRLVFQSPEPARIGRWKREMSKADLASFSRIAGPLLTKLGYET